MATVELMTARFPFDDVDGNNRVDDKVVENSAATQRCEQSFFEFQSEDGTSAKTVRCTGTNRVAIEERLQWWIAGIVG